MKETPQAFKRYVARLGLAAAVVVAFVAFVGVASASAAQHWAGAAQKPISGSQSFTGKYNTGVTLKWKYFGAPVTTTCNGGFPSSGTASNPGTGGSGTLGSVAMTLEGCSVNVPTCSYENGRIAFEPLKGTTAEEAGKDLITLVPETGTTATILHFKNNGGQCPFGTITVSGSIVASTTSNTLGKYELEPYASHLYVGSMVITPEGDFKLSNAGSEALVLSSVASPGVPHWLTGSSAWTNLAAGEFSPYSSSGSMSLGISVKIGLANVKVTCAGSGNVVSGAVENPLGGGAGSATGTMLLSECTLSGAPSCTLQLPAKSTKLTGVAGELAGRRVIEFSPSEGTTVVKFLLAKAAEGSCALGESITLSGKVIASSEGNGNFDFASSELKAGANVATTTGNVALRSVAGEYLRLQP